MFEFNLFMFFNIDGVDFIDSMYFSGLVIDIVFLDLIWVIYWGIKKLNVLSWSSEVGKWMISFVWFYVFFL